MLSAHEFSRLLVDLSILLAIAHLFGGLFVRLRQPRVIGEIAGGMLLGPTCLFTLIPQLEAWVMPPSGHIPASLSAMNQLGMVLIMYAAGAEMRGFSGAGDRKLVAALVAGGIVLPFVGGAVLSGVVDCTQFVGEAKNHGAFVLVFSAAVAVTSISVISRIMLDLKVLDTAFARVVLSTAVAEDVVLYVVLAVAMSMVESKGSESSALLDLLGVHPGLIGMAVYHGVITVVFLIVSLRWGKGLVARLLRESGQGIASAVAVELALLLGFTGATSLLGITPLFGALVMGMLASAARGQAAQPTDLITRFSSAFFIPLYFVMIGVRLDLLRHLDVLWFLGFLAFGCAVKIASVYLAARTAGERSRRALDFALALNARGGPAIVMASVALEAHIISEGFFSIMVLMAIITSLMAGAWLSGRSARELDARTERADERPRELSPSSLREDAVHR